MNRPLRWDIFCTVVDNYGDIGVCWRLARQLAHEHDLQVRLWVDDLAPLASLCPDTDTTLVEQHIDGVDIRLWSKAFPDVESADVVIEAFACELPERYLAAMVQCEQAPVWINLEYLSAEDWIDGAHGMASPHPRLPLTKYFFFPGFTARTGGLIREAYYAKRAAAFDGEAFRAKLGVPPKRRDELTISLFGYENTGLPGLLEVWAKGARQITCLVPESKLLPEVQHFFGETLTKSGHGEPVEPSMELRVAHPSTSSGRTEELDQRFFSGHEYSATTMHRGSLTVHVIPFLPQDDYDALLWLCDLNFVRGEDSFVRAQWAEKPFVWHIYPQADAAHIVKLNAFLDRYNSGLSPEAAAATRNFWAAWNSDAGDGDSEWPALAAALPTLNSHAPSWVSKMTKNGNLALNLRNFCDKLLSQRSA